MDGAATDQTIVLLIHGTFAYEASDEGSAWWQLGGTFERFLAENFGADYAVQSPDEIFKWSGENLESARRAAAVELGRRIAGYERADRRYAFVAHSHGGSVLFDALVTAHRDYPGLPNLARWVTVGTPYLRYRADRSVWWLLAPTGIAATSLAILIPAQWNVLAAHWLEYVTEPRWAELAITTGSLLMLGYALVVLVIYLARCARSQRAELALESRRKAAYERLRDRHVTLVSPDDEAVNGLGSTLQFQGELVVRPPKWWAVAFRYLLAPIADEFIWRQLAKRAQGNDLAGLRMAAVLPVPEEGVAATHIDGALTAGLTESADRRLAGIAASFRKALYSIGFGGRSIDYLRELALSSGLVTSLVHTTYFDDAGLRTAIAAGLKTGMGSASSSTVRPERPLGKTGFYMIGLSVAICSVVLIVFALCYTTLHPLTPAALIESTLSRVSFFDLTQTSSVEEAFRLFEDVQGSDLQPDFYAQSERADTKRRAEASMAIVDAHIGERDRAYERLKEASEQVVQASLPPGVAGPLPAIVSSDLAVARAWGHIGRAEDARVYVARFDPLVRTQVVAALASGLREARDRDGFFEWLPLVDDATRQADLLDRTDPPLCITSEQAASLKATPEVAASILLNRVRCSEPVNFDAELSRIRDASARVRAGIGIVRMLASRDRDLAARLLAAEQAGFPSYPRHPLDGRAALLVQYAEAWLDLARPDEALKLIAQLETMPADVYGDATVEDKSAARRALVWARLGDKGRALHWWRRLPEGAGAIETKLDVLRMMVRAWPRGDPPDLEALLADRPDAAVLENAVIVYRGFGIIDATGNMMSPRDRVERLRFFEAEMIGGIEDSAVRSKANADLADLLLNAGLLRPALRAIERAQPSDRIAPLRHAMTKYVFTTPIAGRTQRWAEARRCGPRLTTCA